jgi:hypothetical protein
MSIKEPFLMNPYVGIINHPRKRKTTVKKGKVKSMARKSSKAHMAYVRSFRKNAGTTKRRKATKRRKNYKRNPFPVAGAVIANPRRKRRNSPKRSHARRNRSTYSRNPRIFGIELPPIQKVVFAGVGFIAPPMIEGFVSPFIPAGIQSNTFGKYAVRIGIVAALGYAIGRFLGREKGNMALIGGGVYIVTTAAMEFVPSIFGANVPAIPSTTLPGTQHSYVGTNIRAYVPANQRVNTGLGLPSAAFYNNESSGAIGNTAVRFKRF